jgi:hypothetical protein
VWYSKEGHDSNWLFTYCAMNISPNAFKNILWENDGVRWMNKDVEDEPDDIKDFWNGKKMRECSCDFFEFGKYIFYTK